MVQGEKFPKFVVGAFVMDYEGKLLLRTTPSQHNRFTCLNSQVRWGDTIEHTLHTLVREKANLEIDAFKCIGLTDGLHAGEDDQGAPIHMVFADYKVMVREASAFKPLDASRQYLWLTPVEWLKKDENDFGPYIVPVIRQL